MMSVLMALNIEKLKERANSGERQPNGTLKNSVKRARNILNILKRDNFKCTVPGCNSKERLTIDHTNGRAFAKHDNYQKYKLSKCKTMCIPCHNKKNGRNKTNL